MRVGVIGAGRIGGLHAATLASLPSGPAGDRVAEVWIHDVDPARSAAVAARSGARPVATLAELWAGVDAVVVATSTSTHPDLVIEAARAGLPVFCEKPISLDLAETDRVLAEVDKAGVPLMIGFQRRFDPGYVRVRELAASGALGTLYLARSVAHDAVPPPTEYLPTSGGIFTDLHIHEFDAVAWVTGQRVVEVYADGAVLVDEAFAAAGDVDTTALVMRLSGGALALSGGGRHDPRGYDHRMELLGSRDSVATGYDRVPLRFLDPAGPATPDDPWPGFLERFNDAYRAELAAFADLAAGGGDNPCPGEAARTALVVALAATRSRREHRPVPVEEIDR
ncbi:MAG: Gfo/Idh/MocA family oxidoreductase [Mycobacteriales bacterium]